MDGYLVLPSYYQNLPISIIFHENTNGFSNDFQLEFQDRHRRPFNWVFKSFT